jgi:hypothetical protein
MKNKLTVGYNEKKILNTIANFIRAVAIWSPKVVQNCK